MVEFHISINMSEITNFVFKGFYDTLIDNLENYVGEYESFIDYGLLLFKLLCQLFNSNIDNDLRFLICGAIAYM